jgi:hypothetical protein
MNRFGTLRARVQRTVLAPVLIGIAIGGSVFGLFNGASATTVASGHMGVAALPANCSTNQLVIWINTQANGAAGSSYYNLEFTNLSAKTCLLAGYPGVSAVNLGGHQDGSSAARNAVIVPKAVTLEHGRSAIAILQITNTGDYPAASCHSGLAAGLRVYPPNQSIAKVVPFPFAACLATGQSYLHIEAVQLAH